MKARNKFLIGGAIILGAASYLMVTSIRQTGVYYLTPTELSSKISTDPSFYETGVKVGARVVPGSIIRDASGRSMTFSVTDGAHVYPVSYRGLPPDTFT
ncbi:MAG: cytochrome c maturation protein CcmE, partial [Gemmatimonadota bacterium]